MFKNTAPGPGNNIPNAPTGALCDGVLSSDKGSLRNERLEVLKSLRTNLPRLSGKNAGDAWRAYDIPSDLYDVRSIIAVGEYPKQPGVYRTIVNRFRNETLVDLEIVRVEDYIFDIVSSQLTARRSYDWCKAGEMFEGPALGPLIDNMLRSSPDDRFLAYAGSDYEAHLPAALLDVPQTRTRLFTQNLEGDDLIRALSEERYKGVIRDNAELLALRSLAAVLEPVHVNDRIEYT